MKRGEITVVTVLVGLGITALGFFGKSLYDDMRKDVVDVKTTQQAQAKLDQDQSVAIGKVETNNVNLDQRMTRIESKIDLLLQNQGINYKEKIEKK